MNGACHFDDLPYIVKRQVIEYATFANPSLLFSLRLVSRKWKFLAEKTLQARSWDIQNKQLHFELLKEMYRVDASSRSLKGLCTLVRDEAPPAEPPDSAFAWHNQAELYRLRDFVDRPNARVEKNVLFLHGSAGNGTTHLVRRVAHYSQPRYHVRFLCGHAYCNVPDRHRLHNVFKDALSNAPSVLIIDDVDKMIFEYSGHIGNSWYEQRDELIELLESVRNVQSLRIILTSNELTLFRTEYHKFIAHIIHVPYKGPKERLHILSLVTRDLKLAPDIQLTDLVKRFNGHVVKAIYCVCRRAASLAIVQAAPHITHDHFTKAIQYVVFRQGIRPFVIRPRPSVATLENPLIGKSLHGI